VVISNHDTPEVRELYRDWNATAVEVRRSVAADAKDRGKAQEIVASLGPPARGAISRANNRLDQLTAEGGTLRNRPFRPAPILLALGDADAEVEVTRRTDG
jgi:hypothetical protein